MKHKIQSNGEVIERVSTLIKFPDTEPAKGLRITISDNEVHVIYEPYVGLAPIHILLTIMPNGTVKQEQINP